MKKKYLSFGEALKNIRTSKGITQTEMSSWFGYSNGQYISNCERGLCPLPRPAMKVLVRKLKLDQMDRGYLFESITDDHRREAEKYWKGILL